MTPFQTFIAHLVTLLAVVGAACALGVEHTISGATAVAILASAGGITLGSVTTTGGAAVAATAVKSVAGVASSVHLLNSEPATANTATAQPGPAPSTTAST